MKKILVSCFSGIVLCGVLLFGASHVSAQTSPTSPLNVRGTATSPSSITVSWSAPVSGRPAGYHVYRRCLGGGTMCIATQLNRIATTTGTSYTDQYLNPSLYVPIAPGTNYEYSVAAYSDSAGLVEGPRSLIASVGTPLYSGISVSPNGGETYTLSSATQSMDVNITDGGPAQVVSGYQTFPSGLLINDQGVVYPVYIGHDTVINTTQGVVNYLWMTISPGLPPGRYKLQLRYANRFGQYLGMSKSANYFTINNPFYAQVTSKIAPATDVPPGLGNLYPYSGLNINGPTSLSAVAYDNLGVTGVTFAIDGTPVGLLGVPDTTVPYGVTWDSSTVAAGAHTLTVTATDVSGKTATASTVFSTGVAPAVPVVTLTASPTSVTSGQPSTLTWSSTNNPISCTLFGSNGWTETVAAQGTKIINPVATSPFSMTCINAGGTSATVNVTVVVTAATPSVPVVMLSASPVSIVSGQTSTLTWSSTNTNTSPSLGCIASGGWTGAKAAQGTQAVTPTVSTTYSLACINATGTSTPVNASVTVTIPQTTSGTVSVKRVDSTFTVLSGTQAKTDALTLTAANPADFTSLSVGSHTAYATDLTGYDESVAQCSYAIGGTECSMASAALYSSANVTCSGGYCSVPVTVADGQVSKVVFRYTASSANATTGSVRIKRVDSSLAVISGTQAKVETSSLDSTNPADVASVPTGVHTAYVTDLTGYDEFVAQCSYAIGGTECTIPTASSYLKTNVTCSNGLCSVPVTVINGQVSKVVFEYVPVTNPTINGTVRVWRLDSSTANYMTGTQAKVDTSALSSANSADFTNIAPGSHVAYVTDLAGYDELASQCTYQIGGNNCATSVQSYSTTGVVCSAGFCAVPTGVTAGNATNVYFKYVPSTLGTPVPTATISASPASLTAVGQSTTLTWSSTNASSCTASGSWSGAKATSGTVVVTPPSNNASYNLSCTGTGGSSPWASVTITIGAQTTSVPVVTLTASPVSISLGQSSTLAWSSTNGATSCSATGGWSGAKGASGSLAVTPTANTTYSLACSNSAGPSLPVSASVTIGSVTQNSVSVLPWTGPSSATIGSPISYSLKWSGGPMSATWDAFIHFVKTDNPSVIFGTGFRPSPDTTQWSGAVTTLGSYTVPSGTTPGTYKVMVGLYNGSNRITSLVAGSGVTQDDQYRYQVGTITINAPVAQQVAVQTWALPANTVVAQGASKPFSLNWSGGPRDKDWQVFIHFVKTDNPSVMFGAGFWPSPTTSHWSGNVSTSDTFTVPANQPLGTYNVMVGLYLGADRATDLQAGSNVVEDHQYRFQVGTITVVAPTAATTNGASVWGVIRKLLGM